MTIGGVQTIESIEYQNVQERTSVEGGYIWKNCAKINSCRGVGNYSDKY